ncbi:MAG: N5-glutamine methyltransferase family protein [Candidatus Aminicenantales bacterium]
MRLLEDCPDPYLEAKLLLLHATGISEQRFFSSPEKKLSEAQKRKFFALVEKRRSGVPLAYLTGKKEFWSIPFKILPGVFIPRPETELVVEKVVEFSSGKRQIIVDIGTGCGNIAISLAAELPQAEIVATDISERALKLARMNALKITSSSSLAKIRRFKLQGQEAPESGCRRLSTSDEKINNITFAKGSLFTPLKRLNLEGKCDFIVSNPPYVLEKEWEELSPSIRGHEPKSALVGGKTGLEFIEKLVKGSPLFLKPGGMLIIEIGYGQRDKVLSLFEEGWIDVCSHRDLSSIYRVISARYRPQVVG